MEGVLYYCNKSRKHFGELMHSVKSLKSHNPDIKVALFTDRSLKSNLYFDYIFPTSKCIHPLQAKVLAIANSPFENSLFLDVDTEVVKPIENLFKHLVSNELCLSRELSVDFSQRPPKLLGFQKKNEFNTGLLLYKQTPLVKEFFAQWKKAVFSLNPKKIELGVLDDQTVFNDLYNKKYPKPTITPLDNTVYGVRYWAYHALDEAKKNEIVIKHWHMLNRSKISIKLEGLIIYALRKMLGIQVFQRA